VTVEPITDLVGLSDIRAAAERIKDLVVRTPVIGLPHPVRVDELLHCKAESLQPTGAFKLRGAYNAISQVLDQARDKGVVAQSSGNHARAVAWLARRLDLHAVIVMPDAAPPSKIAAVRAFGVDVELVPAAVRDIRPLELAAEFGYVHIPPYDDPRVIAGQGTVGLELIEQLPDVDVILVPVSGGGLISGISTAVKALRPDVQIIGVEPELAADAAESLRQGGENHLGTGTDLPHGRRRAADDRTWCLSLGTRTPLRRRHHHRLGRSDTCRHVSPRSCWPTGGRAGGGCGCCSVDA
jgi:threonine dehydratase